MGLLTIALTMLATGTVGPFVLILLMVLYMMAVGGGSAMGMARGMVGAGALAGMAAFLMLVGMVALVGLLGQILCLFTPLSQDTKTKLGLCLVLSFVGGFIPFIGGFLVLGGMVCYLLFLYGVCQDLEAPDLTAGFNSSALLGLLSFLSMFGGLMMTFIIPPAGLLGSLAFMLLGALSVARYGQTMVSLAVRANQLRLQGAALGGGQVAGHSEMGFTPFEEPVAPSRPALPAFEMAGSELVKLPELNGVHEATRVGDVEKVNAMLRPAKPDPKGPNGLTPLHIAAISGVMQVADLLLKKGANVDETCDGGLTAIYFAIQNNNGNLVGLLLQRGASLRHANDQGRTPLHWACAVPSDRLEGQTRLRMVQLLLSRGADRTALDEDGKTAFELAAAAGHSELADL